MYSLLFIILLSISRSINLKDDPSYGENKVDYPDDTPPIQTIDHIVAQKMPLLWLAEDTKNCLDEKNLFDTVVAESTYKFKNSEIICSTGTDLSDILSNFDEKIPSIMIKDDLPSLEIDLNQLNHKMEVFISGIEEKDDSNTGGDEEDTDLKLLSKKAQKRKSNISKRTSSTQQLKIVGNIKSKVYNLNIQFLEVQIINSPLKVNSVVFDNCNLHTDSLSIEANRMFLCLLTHSRISKNQQYDKIHVKQFTVTDYNFNGYEKPCYYITFGSDSLKILTRDYGMDNQVSIYDPYTVDEEQVSCVIPYSCCEMVAFLAKSHFYHFNFEGNSVNTIPVNITIFSDEVIYEDPPQSGNLLADEKYKVYISSDSDWDNQITEKTTVYITGFMNCLDIDTSHCSTNIEVNKFSHYLESGYDPDQDDNNDDEKSQAPSEEITDDDNNDKESQEIVTPEISSKEDDGKDDDDDENTINTIGGSIEFNKNDINGFINEVKKKFEGDDVKENTINVLTVTLPNDETTYDFKNLDLPSNHYLKLDDGSVINLNDGNLNLILDKNKIPPMINIGENNNNNVNLSILNLEENTLKINSLSQEKKDIYIKSESILNKLLKVEAQQNVKSITFDSIILRENGKIQNDKEEVIVKVNSISVQSKSESEINNIEIGSNLNVTQTSHVTISNSKIEETTINIFLSSFDADDFDKKPILTGNFVDESKKIALFSLIKNNDEVKENTGYLLIEGTFINCNNWANNIVFGDTGFNEGVCSDTNSLNADEEKKKEFLFVKKVNQPSSDKGKKLSGGAIAGIVIGCVAVVAIIVVVVVLVVRKKSAVQNSSEQ